MFGQPGSQPQMPATFVNPTDTTAGQQPDEPTQDQQDQGPPQQTPHAQGIQGAAQAPDHHAHLPLAQDLPPAQPLEAPPEGLPVENDPDSANRRSTRSNKGQFTSQKYHQEFSGLESTFVDRELYSFAAMYEHHNHETITAKSATSDPDVMYFHQAMRQPDSQDFLEAVKKEFKDLLINGIFHFVPKKSAPAGATLFPEVWAIKRKRRVETREIYKWKARLNTHGGQQEHRVNFWETYSPVMNWFSIRLFLVISILQSWETR